MASFPGVPAYLDDHKEFLRRIARVVNNLLIGKANAGGTLTLTANVASTTLTDARLGFESALHLIPTTANAATELGNGTLRISETSRVNGSVVITHANNAQADRTFRFTIMG